MAQWAYENYRSKDKPKPQFLIVALQRQHRDERGWWHNGVFVSIIACAYLLVLAIVLRRASTLRSQCVRCVQCQIPFLTAVMNRGRSDMRCPMGCQVAHKSKHSTARSTAYNQTTEGKDKKKAQNDKRKKGGATARSSSESPHCEEQDDPMLRYLRSLVSAIERRRVEMQEILVLWRWIEDRLRQHPFANPEKMVKTLLSDG